MALGAGAGPPHQQPPPAKETPVVITAKPPTTKSRVNCLLSRIENLLFFVCCGSFTAFDLVGENRKRNG
jgi:hypothetical protein